MRKTLSKPIVLLGFLFAIGVLVDLVDTLITPPHDNGLMTIFDGCDRPVFDPRDESKRLFHAHLDQLDEKYDGGFSDKREDPIFIAQCGEEFVLFNGKGKNWTAFGGITYVRFERSTGRVIREQWG